MDRLNESEVTLPVFSPDLQIQFWSRLQLLRNECLGEALSDAIRRVDVTDVDRELAAFVGKERLGEIAAYSLRGEVLFPVPRVFQTKPALLGYYRLLYGVSQKDFYKGPV